MTIVNAFVKGCYVWRTKPKILSTNESSFKTMNQFQKFLLNFRIHLNSRIRLVRIKSCPFQQGDTTLTPLFT